VFDHHLFFKIAVNLKYELLAVCRCYQDMIYPLLFLILAIVLFPLSVSPDPVLLNKISAGIFWIIVLFLVLLMLEQLFRDDWKEGDLEQLILMPNALTSAIFIKLLVFWLVISLPLIVMTPFLSLVLYIPINALKTLCWSIFLGTPSLIFLGGIARALTLGLRHSGFLIVLIVIPFYIPVLIFASSAVAFANIGLSANGPLAWLGVLMLLSVSLSPFIISVILRLGIAFA
jgi:heme exporter protein B